MNIFHRHFKNIPVLILLPRRGRLYYTHFISRSAPDIRKILKKLEDGPETPQRELLNVAFKVFHNREEQEKEDLKNRDQEKYFMLAKALKGSTSQGSKSTQKERTTSTPSGACFKCKQHGHWARQCPNQRTPPGPCPHCHVEGHWGVDCPSRQRGGWIFLSNENPHFRISNRSAGTGNRGLTRGGEGAWVSSLSGDHASGAQGKSSRRSLSLLIPGPLTPPCPNFLAP